MNMSRTDSTGSRETSTDSNTSSIWANIDHSSTYRNALRDTDDFPEDFLDTSSPKKSVVQSVPEVPKYEASASSMSSSFDEAMDRQNHEYLYGTNNFAASMGPYTTHTLDNRHESSYTPETGLVAMNDGYYVDNVDYVDQPVDQQFHSYQQVAPIPFKEELARCDEHHQFVSEVKRERTEKQSRKRKQNFADGSEGVKSTKRYSTKDENDPLNAKIPSDVSIDTANICDVIATELKTYAISQTLFAERVLCRSQGTLSDLLRNPKPWNELKSGRATFTRMYNWLMLPVDQRLGLLGLALDNNNQVVKKPRLSRMERLMMAENEPRLATAPKRARFVFNNLQKRSLLAVYDTNQRPTKDLQDMIADNLKLTYTTVANFFMNQRRRHNRAQKKAVASQVEVAPVEQVQVEQVQVEQQLEQQVQVYEESESEEDEYAGQPGQIAYQYDQNVMDQ